MRADFYFIPHRGMGLFGRAEGIEESRSGKKGERKRGGVAMKHRMMVKPVVIELYKAMICYSLALCFMSAVGIKW